MSLFGLGAVLIGIWYVQQRDHDGGRAGDPDVKELVLQLGDLPPGYKRFVHERSSETVGSESAPGYSVLYRREKVALGTLLTTPLLVASTVTTFRTPAAARLKIRDLVRRNAGPQTSEFRSLRAPRIGNGTLFYQGQQQVPGSPLRAKFLVIAWRHGRMVATVATVGVEKGQRRETIRLARLEQIRLAAVH
jgi:hypothetical protein